MQTKRIRSAGRSALALTLAAVLSGCVSVRTTRSKATGEAPASGSLDIAVYDTPAQARGGVATTQNISLELGRLEKGGPEAPVQTSSSATLSLGSLPPGRYRLHLKTAALPGSQAPAPKITEEDIRIAAGETVRTRVILKEFPTRAVVGAALCVGAGIGIVYAIAASMFSGPWGNAQLSRSPAGKSAKARGRRVR